MVGIQQSLNMTSRQFETAVAILFVGYIMMQVPSNFILARLRPSIYLPACMVVWGGISLATGFVHTARELLVVRFFLGFVEAPFGVGILFLISSFYTRSELCLRSALLLSAPMMGNAFSGLLGAGITRSLDGVGGLEAWRWMFITGGASTIVVASVAFFVLPDFPSNTRWLSPKERAVAEWRLFLDAGQVDEDEDDWKYGISMAVKDWRVYAFAALFLLASLASSTINFFPQIVETLGFRRVHTLLLTVPPYIVGVLVATLNSWAADWTGNCSFHIIAPLATAIAGFILSAASDGVAVRYFAMILMIAAGHGANAILLAWVQKTMVRPRMKRAIALAFVNSTGNISQASHFFLTGWSPSG